MRTIHIGICHNNNLIITQFGNIEIVAVSLGKTASKRIDHGLDLRIGQHFINTCFLNIQNFSTDWKNRLEITITGGLCGTTGRISLDDENLTFGSIPALTVCQFSVGIKRKFLFRQQICFCLFLCLANLCCFFRTGKHCF